MVQFPSGWVAFLAPNQQMTAVNPQILYQLEYTLIGTEN